MNLRFIGTDGSMGLTHGKVYRVALRPNSPIGVRLIEPVLCPYASDAAFWRNWELP